MFNLLLKRRFVSFFICQFLGAANDSVFRLALVAMLSFGIFKSDSSHALVALSAALFMLPFFLFSAVAGELIDAMSKRRVLILIKSGELVIMIIASIALTVSSLPLLLLCLFLTGAQSAFFGPLKYSLLPALLRQDELLNGNAWFSVSTFAAILLGTILGTAGGQSAQLAPLLAGGFVALSLAGLIAAYWVPLEAASTAADKWRFAPVQSFRLVYKTARANRKVFDCILAGSWFWLLGVMLLNELARLAYHHYIQMLAAVFLGVAIGAVLCYLVLRNTISTRYTPLTLLIATGLLWYISRQLTGDAAIELFIAIALFGAVMTLYVVPLRATIQILAAEENRAKVIAAYNIFNALFIVLGSALGAAAHFYIAADTSSQTLLQFTCLFSFIAVFYTLRVVPIESVRRVLALILRPLFRVRVYGSEHLQESATYICNHQSMADGILLAVFLQNQSRQLCFPIDVAQSQRFLARHILKLVRFYSLNPMEPQAIKSLVKDIKSDPQKISPLVFVEGRITRTGNLMKSYPGVAIIADKISDGKVTPVIIDGLQYSKFSRMQGKFPLRLFPAVTINIFPPRHLSAPAELLGAEKRRWITRQLDCIMEESAYQVRVRDAGNLTACFAKRAGFFGGGTSLFAEFPARQLTYRQSFRAAFALGELLARDHAVQSRIGLMLPSSVGSAVFLYAAIFRRLTPVLLNPSAGATQVLSACRTATVTTVYTSQRLLEHSAAAKNIAEKLQQSGIRVVLLEDLREQLTWSDKLKAARAGAFMHRAASQLPGYHADGDEHACILFTSGSEGFPKGVVLSHKNIITNCCQVQTRIDINQQDIMLNTLPVFHSFGLLAGVILPMMSGVTAWQYPSPLHYQLIPEAAYGINATIFFSANTFLSNYGRVAHPLDFTSLRLVLAGAEKLQPETRELWADKFGVRILEGYGVTETSPVIAVNSPLHYTAGTVGRLLPGITPRLEDVPGIESGKRLLVRGDNIMQGYFLADAPGQLAPPAQGWHDTGDIVEIDDNGYMKILGRAKRFIKIAGEMVPLDSVEACLQNHWEGLFAVVGVSDVKRGECLALMTTADISREQIKTLLQSKGFPELWQPREIRVVKEFPLLSTGKIDYPAVTQAFTPND